VALDAITNCFCRAILPGFKHPEKWSEHGTVCLHAYAVCCSITNNLCSFHQSLGALERQIRW
jgi:hypothetical protein